MARRIAHHLQSGVMLRSQSSDRALCRRTTTGKAMSATNDSGRDFFVAGLRNQHAVENQAVELLQRQIDRLENYPEMVARMQQHVAESQTQAQRIEELLSRLGESHSSVKDTVMSFMGNMAALAHMPAQDEVIKNTFANLAFEHFEIASYKSLITVAEAIGHTEAASALNASLSEEEDMARWIDEHIRPTTLRYIERHAAGAKAGV
jgi:ferritin-like metal-binding protein YciE